MDSLLSNTTQTKTCIRKSTHMVRRIAQHLTPALQDPRVHAAREFASDRAEICRRNVEKRTNPKWRDGEKTHDEAAVGEPLVSPDR